ncbi:hypothetical protein [Mitsuokella multacida]|uniref:hypothetical protein n=1 Tax=Mitsuokella multacida TaxID=52226 RepID=UPI003F625514
MAKYLDKWKDLFPDTVGGTTRPSEAVSDQEEFNTDGFPQFIAQDPVNYALQNAFLKQFLSNDAWLWVKQKQANQALDDHKVDTQAHAKGISGNAGSATKLANARTIKLTGDVSGSATFNGTADASIDTTVSNATQATKLKTARSINLSGAVTADAASFDGTADATINVKTLDASKLKGTTSVSTTGNAATASKLASPRTISLTGKAAGSTSFDGSANASINVKSVNADTASKLSTARKINITGNATGAAAFDGSGDVSINVSVNSAAKATNDKNGADIAATYLKKAGDTTTGKITFASTDLNTLPEVKKTSDDKMSGIRFSSKTKFLGAVGKRLSNGEDLLNLRSDNSSTDVVLDSRNYGSYALPKSGGNMSGPLNFANATWNLVGDDSYIGDHDIGGTFCVKGANGETGIALVNKGNENDYARISYGGGNINFNKTIGGNISGNAATATKLQTPRTISLTGNATGSANFDGSDNVSINTTVSQAANAESIRGSRFGQTTIIIFLSEL